MNKYRVNTDEWIEILKKNNLNIIDGNKFKWYIESYNFFNFVKKYSAPLCINNDANKNYYKSNSNSQMIIELFNIDRNLSNIILSDIFSIERKLSTVICKELIFQNEKSIPEISYCKFSDLSNYQIKKLFPKLEKKVFSNKNEEKKYRNNKVRYFKDKFIKKSKDKIFGELFLEFTFGQLCEIVSFLNNYSRKNISKSFLKININKDLSFSFMLTLEMINHLRNLICHNHPIYDINYRKWKDGVYYKTYISNLYSTIFGNEIDSIRLFNVVEIISEISPHETDLIKIFDKKIVKLKEKTNEEFSNEIKIIMNYIY